jgi:pimeloyl-ACP methyl ester carboxylesterase
VLSGVRRIRYRRRGYGHSATPSEPPTIEEHARDAKGLLVDLGVEAAHVVAHSGGGPVAIQLAVDDPEMVRSMVLLEPALMNATMAAGFHEVISPLVEMHAAGRSAEAVELWMSAGNPDWKALIEERIPGAADQAIADAAGTFDFDLRAMRVWDFSAVDASRITQPVLYVTGTRSAYRPSITAMFQNAVHHTTTATIADADHIAPMTDPSTVAAVVAAFIQALPIGSDSPGT